MDATTVKAILKDAQPGKYVLAVPMTQRELGIKLFEAEAPVDACLTDEMRRGWLWALRASSNADAAAYMVSQGQEVRI